MMQKDMVIVGNMRVCDLGNEKEGKNKWKNKQKNQSKNIVSHVDNE